jgi:hypothetical protein
MYNGREQLDDLVWDKNDDEHDESLKRMRLSSTCRKVERLAEQLFCTTATFVSPIILGGFNILYRIGLTGISPDDLLRLPCPSLVQFPKEKTPQEVATTKYIAEHTAIPIPKHFFAGEDETLGPYIILQYVDARGKSMSGRTAAPTDDSSIQYVLDPSLPSPVLETIWTKAATCLLQLSHLTFPRIGALEQDAASGAYRIAGRPLTYNMTAMTRLANIPRAALPSEGSTYTTADAWYTTLTEMNLAQLVFQRNEAVSSADDCRNKYVARQIFWRLARQGRLAVFGFAEDDWSAQAFGGTLSATEQLAPAPEGTGDFRLWGDNFRAGNLLMGEDDELVAAIDWEFAYAAPTQFALDPPRWLLLSEAEMWAVGSTSGCGCTRGGWRHGWLL